MQQNIQQNQYYIQEDEIDLRELWKTLVKRKNFIIIFTAIVTILAIIYVLVKTPIYEARALVEIGNYRLYNNNTNNRASLDNGSQLVKKLNILFIDSKKNIKDRPVWIESISVPKKGSKNFIEIIAYGISNELAKQEVQKVVKYIRQKHQKILDDVKKRRTVEINNIVLKIENIKNRTIPLLDKKIKVQEQTLLNFKSQIKQISKNIQKIEDIKPVLTALKLMEKRDLTTFVIKLNTQLMDMRDKRDRLLTTDIAKLRENKMLIESLLLPYNYKNSNVVGDILLNDYPVKPKKKLIVIVAFVTGLILSIFIVFFLEFIESEKKEN
jgi:LPS O-antigen subunit length determinant protein (WzzB/FepE family)